MIIVGLAMQAVGLGQTMIGSYVLLRSLFISDEGIDKLAKLPIQTSRTFGHGASGPFVFSDPGDLHRFRDLYIRKRREERHNGRIALWSLFLRLHFPTYRSTAGGACCIKWKFNGNSASAESDLCFRPSLLTR